MLPIKIDLPERFLEEEVRDGYNVSSEMKKVWAVQIDLLVELDRVCRENGITYYVSDGTILGAARHGGYIPWDDDLDVMMTRENYDKLCACGDAFSEPYFFQTEYNDPGTLRNHAQLRNSATTGVLCCEEAYRYRFNQGIFLDVFPLDNLPDGSEERKLFFEGLNRRNRLAHAVALVTSRHSKEALGGVKGRLIRLLGSIISPIYWRYPTKNMFYRSLERYMQKFNEISTEEMGMLYLLDRNAERYFWKKSDFVGDTVELDFEWIKVPVPSGYLNILEKEYGNWKKFVIGTSDHGEVIFDPQTSYREYLK